MGRIGLGLERVGWPGRPMEWIAARWKVLLEVGSGLAPVVSYLVWAAYGLRPSQVAA